MTMEKQSVQSRSIEVGLQLTMTSFLRAAVAQEVRAGLTTGRLLV